MSEAVSTLKRKTGHTSVAYKINCALVALVVVICVYPFLNVLAYSLSGNKAILSGEVTFYPIDPQLNAYKDILKKKPIWDSMFVSVVTTVTGTAIGLSLTVCAAYALAQKKLALRKPISGLILFTMYFNGGIIPTFLVVKGLGMYDTYWSLIVPSAVNVFNFIVMRTFFREIPESLQEAAFLDGASDMQVLFKVVLPLSVPILATIGLFYAVSYWNDYFSSLIYIQTPEKFPLQLRLRQLLFADQLNQMGSSEGLGNQVVSEALKMACVMVATTPIILVYPWLQKYFVKGVMLGSVKG